MGDESLTCGFSTPFHMSCASGGVSHGEPVESEEESPSDLDETGPVCESDAAGTVSKEQDHVNEGAAVGSAEYRRVDHVENEPVFERVSAESGDHIDTEPAIERGASGVRSVSSRLRARVSGVRVGSQPVRGRNMVRRLRERIRDIRGTLPATPQGVWGSLTKVQWSAVGSLVSRGVTTGTKRGYERHWDKWIRFLADDSGSPEFLS